jgi:hypothetical protein
MASWTPAGWLAAAVLGAALVCLGAGPAGAAADLSAAAADVAASPLLPPARLDVLAQQTTPQEPELVIPGEPKSIYKAAFLSMLVPGLGEYYSGHPNRALVFGTMEAAIWIAYATFSVQEGLRADRAEEFAAQVAGANPSGDADYFEAVGRFPRNDGPGMWNEYVRRRARDTGEVVGPEYFGADNWAWPSDDQLARYRSMRSSMLEAEDNATNMLAVAILNRIVSTIDVVQAVRSDHKKQRDAGLGLELRLGCLPGQLASVGIRNRF